MFYSRRGSPPKAGVGSSFLPNGQPIQLARLLAVSALLMSLFSCTSLSGRGPPPENVVAFSELARGGLLLEV